jgi:hypothetical protein
VRCDVARRSLSERLDDGLDQRRTAAIEAHLATCPGCRSFEHGIRRVREMSRLRPAAPVPDLVPVIMERIRGEAPVPLRLRTHPWTRHATAFAAGAIAAAILVAGLPGVRRTPPAVLATEIPRGIAEASADVTAYRTTFRVVEHGFHRRVPRRTFLADVAFRAPERFRAHITDLTPYPGPGWPANEVTLAVDGERWMLDSPRGCPRGALPGCAPGGRDTVRVTGRPPFDGDAPMPTDVILPVRTLAGTGRVAVQGTDSVLGRDAVLVDLAYRDAAPLFGFLHAGGLWRPFFPHDRVRVALDRETWFPLAFEVAAAEGTERAGWAEANGLPDERPGTVLLRAEAVRFGPGPPEGWRPAGPTSEPATRDLGFREADPETVVAPRPANDVGLHLHRSGTVAGDGTRSRVVVSYARGLSWLVVTATRAWGGPGLFGDVTELAQRVRVGSGVGYYEPATGTLGRRLAIHTGRWDLELESNLAREDLVTVAASVPVVGRTAPTRWLDRVSVPDALEATSFALMPSTLPTEFRPWTARLDGRDAVTVWFRRPGSEPGPGIVLHQARGAGLPPPLEGEVLAVRVREQVGRYSPSRELLEWVEGGVYRSLGGGALDLTGLLAVARSLETPS